MSNFICEHSGISFDRKDCWTNVKDKLPEFGLLILVYNGSHISMAHLSQVKYDDSSNKPSIFRNYFIQVNTFNILNGITHWMHLPEPPKE